VWAHALICYTTEEQVVTQDRRVKGEHTFVFSYDTTKNAGQARGVQWK